MPSDNDARPSAGDDDARMSPDLMPPSDLLAAHKEQNKRCLIDPRSSTRLRYWDALVALCLIYTAILTPYEVAFLPAPRSALAATFLINRAIDIVFLCDMIKEFMVMWPYTTGVKLDGSSTVGMSRQQRMKKAATTYVTDHWLIAKHYLTGWFVVDLVSVLTSFIDIISLIIIAQGGRPDINKLRLLKVLRVLRLIKLVRLLKSSRLFERWQASIELDFSSQTVIRVLTLYMLCGHWFACILVLFSSFSHPLHSWRGAKGYCVDGATFLTELGSVEMAEGTLDWKNNWDQYIEDRQVIELPPARDWVRLFETSQELDPRYRSGDVGVFCVVPIEMWLATYYWMIMLISGAAGGDTNAADIWPIEQVVFTALVVASALLWSQIIASFCDVLSNLNPEHAAFRQRVDNLNRYCRSNRFDVATRRRLREYLYRAKHVQVEESQSELLMLMSPKLQGELSLQVTGSWLRSVRFLQHVEADCVVQIALSLSPAVFVPTERISADSLYYLQRGTVITSGRVIVGDEHWGKECILERQELRAKKAVALTYVEVSYIHRDKLLEITHASATTVDGKYHYVKFPKALRKIKWEAVRLAVVRMLLMMAFQDKEKETTKRTGPGTLQRSSTLSNLSARSKGAWGRTMASLGDEMTMASMEDIDQLREEEKQLRAESSKQKKEQSLLGMTENSVLGRFSKSPTSPSTAKRPEGGAFNFHPSVVVAKEVHVCVPESGGSKPFANSGSSATVAATATPWDLSSEVPQEKLTRPTPELPAAVSQGDAIGDASQPQSQHGHSRMAVRRTRKQGSSDRVANENPEKSERRHKRRSAAGSSEAQAAEQGQQPLYDVHIDV